jgi:hypothetical protein
MGVAPNETSRRWMKKMPRRAMRDLARRPRWRGPQGQGKRKEDDEGMKQVEVRTHYCPATCPIPNTGNPLPNPLLPTNRRLEARPRGHEIPMQK